MTTFDADLVGRWFRRVRDEPVMPHWGIAPTAQEFEALRVGGGRVFAAVQGEGPPEPHTSGLTETPARLVLTYLNALAAGIAGTKAALADSFSSSGSGRGDDISAGLNSDYVNSDYVNSDYVNSDYVNSDYVNSDGPNGAGLNTGCLNSVDVGTMALVAGLNAGAAALHGEISSPAHLPGFQWHAAEPTAAESARQAGVAAAELVVNGAGLQEIVGLAADVAMAGWRIGLPDDPVDRIEYRTRGLLGILLVALELETRDPEAVGEPASCGALPGENLGNSFGAEITFTMGLAPAELRALSDDLAGLVSELAIWPGRDSRNSWPRFHIHTDRPGAVIGQIYAFGTPFELEITDRG